MRESNMKMGVSVILILFFYQIVSIHIEDTIGIKKNRGKITAVTHSYTEVQHRLVYTPNLCLHAVGINSGEFIQLSHCATTYGIGNQFFLWTFQNTIILRINENLCLHVVEGLKSGNRLQLSVCKNDPTDQWEILANGQIRSLLVPTLCIGTSAGLMFSGISVRLANCKATSQDQFFFPTPAGAPQGQLRIPPYGPHDNLCIEAKPTSIGYPLQPGNQLQVQICDHYSPQQRFLFYDDHTLRSTWYPYLCLNAQGGINAQGSNLHEHDLIKLDDCNSDISSQLWDMRPDFTIRSLTKPQFCFNSAGGNLVVGEKLQLYTCSASENEQWMLDADDWQIEKEEPLGSIRLTAKPSSCLWAETILDSNLQLKPCSPFANSTSPYEIFIFDNGYLRFFKYDWRNYCISVPADTPGAVAVVTNCNNARKWIMTEGKIRIKYEGDNNVGVNCLETENDSILNSPKLRLGSCEWNLLVPSQKFFIVTV